MLLVDSLYINVGGGKVLLDYMVKEIEMHQMDVYYLFDLRCKDDFKEVPEKKKLFLKAGLFSRYDFYKKNRHKFSKVFCFGNIPPPIRLKNMYVLTFFQNTLLVNPPVDYSFNNKIKVGLKKLYLHIVKGNTNAWVIQTEFVKKELTNHLNVNDEECFIYPFFELPDSTNVNLKKINTYCYVAITRACKKLVVFSEKKVLEF